MKSVKVADLQTGMKVTEPIMGKKGDIKVNKGEILSHMHVERLKKWKGVDAANPKGINIESSPLHTGQEMPNTVDKPWESPIVTQGSKEKARSTIRVKGGFDKDGNIDPDALPNVLKEKEEDAKPKRGRPKKKTA